MICDKVIHKPELFGLAYIEHYEKDLTFSLSFRSFLPAGKGALSREEFCLLESTFRFFMPKKLLLIVSYEQI